MKCFKDTNSTKNTLSPSMRREWIEIFWTYTTISPNASPSMRREWIEILPSHLSRSAAVSPSMRREWIEMVRRYVVIQAACLSPSMRREWIEMTTLARSCVGTCGLPPCGGSGLKFGKSTKMLLRCCVSLHAEGVD